MSVTNETTFWDQRMDECASVRKRKSRPKTILNAKGLDWHVVGGGLQIIDHDATMAAARPRLVVVANVTLAMHSNKTTILQPWTIL